MKRDCVLVIMEVLCFLFFFFFSSRRRHTRCSRDWSSDVCSSDLGQIGSQANFTKRFGWGNISLGGSGNQSISDGSVQLTAPSFTISQIGRASCRERV